jgi:predicted small secreted protein
MLRRSGACTALVVLFATLALGCETVERAGEAVAFSLNPFASTDVVVTASERHGPYLFVEVHSTKLQERFITPLSEACVRVLGPEATARYQRRGNFGRFVGEDESCDAVGTLSLAARRRPRGERSGGESGIPRSTARFVVAHRDPHYILLRGRFVLASRVGVPAASDIVAVLPEDAGPCRDVASRREASLEFRHSGRDAFRLLSAGPGCVVAGFAMPVEGLPPAPPEPAESATPD